VRAQEGLHHRDRHPQHAAGRPGERHDLVLLHGRDDRVGTDPADLHRPEGRAHGSLHHGTLRMSHMTQTPRSSVPPADVPPPAPAPAAMPLLRTTLTPRTRTAAALPGGQPAVSARDFRFSYDGVTPALKGINLDVAPRAVTAIIGPSGCGKSTFLRSINRLHDLVPAHRYEGEI